MPGSENKWPGSEKRRKWTDPSSSTPPRSRVPLAAPEVFARQTTRGDTHVDTGALDFRSLSDGPLNQQIPANPRRHAPVPDIQSDPQTSGNHSAHPSTSQASAHQSLNQRRSNPSNLAGPFAQFQKYQPPRRRTKKRQRSPSPDQAEDIVAGVAQAQSTEAASDLSQQHGEESPPHNLQNPPLTCYSWLFQCLGWKASGCKSTAEEYPWSHTFTGYVVDKFSVLTTVIQASTLYQFQMKQFKCKYQRRHGLIGSEGRRGCRNSNCQFSHVVEDPAISLIPNDAGDHDVNGSSGVPSASEDTVQPSVPGILGGTGGWEDTKWADEEDMDKKVRLFIESREEEFEQFLESLTRTR